MKYINNNLPLDARILFIFLGHRGYYCDRSYLFDMKGHKSRIEHFVKKKQDVEEVAQGLRNMGITHLLIYHRIFDKWISGGLAPENQVVIRTFLRTKLKRLFFENGYGVYAL